MTVVLHVSHELGCLTSTFSTAKQENGWKATSTDMTTNSTQAAAKLSQKAFALRWSVYLIMSIDL